MYFICIALNASYQAIQHSNKKYYVHAHTQEVCRREMIIAQHTKPYKTLINQTSNVQIYLHTSKKTDILV